MPTHADAFVAFHASEDVIMGFFADGRDLYSYLQDFLIPNSIFIQNRTDPSYFSLEKSL